MRTVTSSFSGGAKGFIVSNQFHWIAKFAVAKGPGSGNIRKARRIGLDRISAEIIGKL